MPDTKQEKPKPRKRVVDLEVHEISLVDQPAVPKARFIISKRRKEGGDTEMERIKKFEDLGVCDECMEKIEKAGEAYGYSEPRKGESAIDTLRRTVGLLISMRRDFPRPIREQLATLDLSIDELTRAADEEKPEEEEKKQKPEDEEKPEEEEKKKQEDEEKPEEEEKKKQEDEEKPEEEEKKQAPEDEEKPEEEEKKKQEPEEEEEKPEDEEEKKKREEYPSPSKKDASKDGDDGLSDLAGELDFDQEQTSRLDKLLQK